MSNLELLEWSNLKGYNMLVNYEIAAELSVLIIEIRNSNL